MQTREITADNFRGFGRVATLPAHEPLARDDTFAFWSDVASYEIAGETEIGFCTVTRQDRNVVRWMERHERTPELLVPIDGPFILPVMTKDGRVEAFRVEPGTAVVIAQDVWHSAGLPVGNDRTTYFVIFRRGTPAEDVIKTDIPPVELAR